MEQKVHSKVQRAQIFTLHRDYQKDRYPSKSRSVRRQFFRWLRNFNCMARIRIWMEVKDQERLALETTTWSNGRSQGHQWVRQQNQAALMVRGVALSDMTVSRQLWQEFVKSTKKPWLIPAVKAKRLVLAKKHQDWARAQWSSAMFSDESSNLYWEKKHQESLTVRNIQFPRWNTFQVKWFGIRFRKPMLLDVNFCLAKRQFMIRWTVVR